MKLAIFKVNQLGDNVVFLPVVQTLRRLQPAWDLLVLTSPLAEPLYAGESPPFERLAVPTREFLSGWKRPWRFARWLRKVRDFQPDACLLGDDQGHAAHLLARLSGARTRIGAASPFLRMATQLTVTVPWPKEFHAAALAWELGRAAAETLQAGPWPATPPPPRLEHLTAGQQPVPGRIVIHPGGSLPFKRWPAARFAALAAQLAAAGGTVLWIASPEVEPMPLPAAITVARPASLAELTALLASAELFIGNNSGPMNLVAALGRPAIIISGPSAPAWDPVWHAERIKILRDETLPCLPCDTGLRTVTTCGNTLEPLACLRFWTVEKVAALCEPWRLHWQGVPLAAARAQ